MNSLIRMSQLSISLQTEINMKNPASTKVPVSASMEISLGSGDGGGKELVKGHKKGRVKGGNLSREDPNDSNVVQ